MHNSWVPCLVKTWRVLVFQDGRCFQHFQPIMVGLRTGRDGMQAVSQVIGQPVGRPIYALLGRKCSRIFADELFQLHLPMCFTEIHLKVSTLLYPLSLRMCPLVLSKIWWHLIPVRNSVKARWSNGWQSLWLWWLRWQLWQLWRLRHQFLGLWWSSHSGWARGRPRLDAVTRQIQDWLWYGLYAMDYLVDNMEITWRKLDMNMCYPGMLWAASFAFVLVLSVHCFGSWSLVPWQKEATLKLERAPFAASFQHLVTQRRQRNILGRLSVSFFFWGLCNLPCWQVSRGLGIETEVCTIASQKKCGKTFRKRHKWHGAWEAIKSDFWLLTWELFVADGMTLADFSVSSGCLWWQQSWAQRFNGFHNSRTEIVTKLNWSSAASIPSATCCTKKYLKIRTFKIEFTLLPLPVLRLVPPAWWWPFSWCWSSWYIPMLENSRLSVSHFHAFSTHILSNAAYDSNATLGFEKEVSNAAWYGF